MKVFSGSSNRPLAQAICDSIGIELGESIVGSFPDGETRVRINENVRGRDCFVVQSTHPPTNHHYMELFIVVDALRRASASRITAVIPFYGYSRQDRKDQPRVPITAKLIANLIVASGVSRVLTIDLHAQQIQGFFDIPVDHLYAAPVLNKYFTDMGIPPEEIAVVSPDEGSIKRAIGHKRRLGGKLAIVDKRRSSATQTAQEHIIGGPVEGRVALMFDDMISTAGSICGAAEKVRDAGAREIHVAVSHAVLCGDARKRLEKAPIDSVVVTNSIPLRDDQQLDKLKVLSVAPILAEAIRRIHRNESISIMFHSN